jgi:tRNA threonylcarbamoyladenosine biosynthesis protein TsaE
LNFVRAIAISKLKNQCSFDTTPMRQTPLKTLTLSLADETETERLGQALAFVAANLQSTLHEGVPGPEAGGRMHLQGDLGAGKTSLARAFLRQCGVLGRIKSPSYALLESYKVSSLYLYHLDFYRFSDPKEWLDAGFRDLLNTEALVLIEWPERAGDLLGHPDLNIQLAYANQGRIATLSAFTARGLKWIDALPQTRLDAQKG